MVFVATPSRKRRARLWATPLLAAVAAAVFAWLAWIQSGAQRQANVLRWGALSGDPEQWQRLWHQGRALTLATALFIHADAAHLIGNGVFLLVFGVPVERSVGPWRLLGLFLLGGVLANLLASLSMGSPGRVIVGASGGVSALIGAYLILFPKARLGIAVPLGLWMELVRAPAVWVIGSWAALQLAFSVAGPAFGAVAWWAHLTGFAIGAAAAAALRPYAARRARGR